MINYSIILTCGTNLSQVNCVKSVLTDAMKKDNRDKIIMYIATGIGVMWLALVIALAIWG